jgi:hypothetical protein
VITKSSKRTFPLRRPFRDGYFDSLEVDPSGLIRICGWSKGPPKPNGIPTVRLETEDVPLLQHYRVSRPDVEQEVGIGVLLQPGFGFEYLVPESFLGRQFTSISVALEGILKLQFKGVFEFINPHYRGLLDGREVYHRRQIYGSGPPNPAVHPDIQALAKKLTGPVLDFGCGSGAMISGLRAGGVDAHGLELESELILPFIQPELRSAITLYDGEFPVPFRAVDSEVFSAPKCWSIFTITRRQ